MNPQNETPFALLVASARLRHYKRAMQFSVFGIPVYVRPMFWLMTILLGMPLVTTTAAGNSNSMVLLPIWVGIVFVSVLIHELGHGLLMRRFGADPEIELWGMGGLTHWGRALQGPVPPWKQALVSLAGPFAGFAFGGLIWGLSFAIPPVEGTLAERIFSLALWANIGWGVFNLMPMLPLDGGHVMEAIMTSVFGPKGRRISAWISFVVSIGIIIASFMWKMPILAFLAVSSAVLSWRIGRTPSTVWEERSRAQADGPNGMLGPIDFEEAMAKAWRQIQGGEAAAAAMTVRRELNRLADDPKVAHLRARAHEMLAWAELEDGNEKAAIAEAARVEPPAVIGPVLKGRLLRAEGQKEEGTRMLEAAFAAIPEDYAGLALGAAYLEDGRIEEVERMVESTRGRQFSSAALVTVSAGLFYAQAYEAATRVSAQGWNRFHDAVHAHNAACSLTKLGRLDDAIAWVENALRGEGAEPARVAQDADLAPLRQHPRWVQLFPS